MRISSLIIFFRILGGVFAVISLLLFLSAATDQQNGTAAALAAILGVGSTFVAIYLLSGAPRLTRWLKELFPHEPDVPVIPRHDHRPRPRPRLRRRAIVGIAGGLIAVLVPGYFAYFGPDPLQRPAALNTALVISGLGAPFLTAWGSAQWARRKGISAAIPYVTAFLSAFFLSVLPAFMSHRTVWFLLVLITIMPPLIVALLKPSYVTSPRR